MTHLQTLRDLFVTAVTNEAVVTGEVDVDARQTIQALAADYSSGHRTISTMLSDTLESLGIRGADTDDDSDTDEDAGTDEDADTEEDGSEDHVNLLPALASRILAQEEAFEAFVPESAVEAQLHGRILHLIAELSAPHDE